MRKIILGLAVLFSLNANSQSKISGVVTYFFNEYQGDKPDLGSKVYAIDSTKAKHVDFELYTKYDNAKSAKDLYERWSDLLKNARKKDKPELQSRVDEYFEKLKKYDAETEDKFDKIDFDFAKSLVKLSDEISFVKTIDNTGSYSFDLPKGTYYVIILSKNRTISTTAEVMGMIYFKKVNLSELQTKDVSHNFKF